MSDLPMFHVKHSSAGLVDDAADGMMAGLAGLGSNRPPSIAELYDPIVGDLAAALDPVIFVRHKLSTVIPQLDFWQVKALRSTSRNTLLLCGRQTGKSTVASILSVHCALAKASQLIILLSPTLRQSSELFAKCLSLIDGLEVKPAWLRRTATEIAFDSGSRIVSLPGANPDSIRGFSNPAMVIEDESAFVDDKTFVASRPFFATSKTDRHILLTTPYGKRGHFYNLWRSKALAFDRISVPSTSCPRITKEFLDDERATLSDRAYRQEYLCEFLEASTAVFAADWIERLVDDDERKMVGVTGKEHGGVLRGVDPGIWSALE